MYILLRKERKEYHAYSLREKGIKFPKCSSSRRGYISLHTKYYAYSLRVKKTIGLKSRHKIPILKI
jgi:hypothetical protein